MEAGQENSGNLSMKRQRAPLSDSEDNALTSSEINDGQKRRRLEAPGVENQSPKPSNFDRIAELGIKADTPIVPSILSRVQQLTQRREGAPPTQRCLSDPGSDCTTSIHDQGIKKHLLGETEFNQRLERFKVPVFEPSPTQNSANLCSRTRSNFVSDIHQKLQGDTTPSSKQASRIRQEREQELSKLQFQPISENAWLKRSSSDSSMPQAEGEAENRDGSFTETLSSAADHSHINTTGGRSASDPEAPSVSVSQLQVLWTEKVEEDKHHRALVQNEEEMLVSQQQQQQQPKTVVELSFSEDQKVSAEEARLPELTHADELNKKETSDVSRAADQSSAEMDLFEDDDHQMDDSSYDEEVIEPSTDEELKMWRYPRKESREESAVSEKSQEELCVQEGEELTGEKEEDEKEVSVVGQSQVSEVQSRECCLSDVSTQIVSSCGVQEDERAPSEDSLLCREQVTTESCNGCEDEEMIDGDTANVTVSQDQKDTEGSTAENNECCEQSEDTQTFTDDEEQTDLSSHSRAEEAASYVTVDEGPDEPPTAEPDLQRNTDDAVQPTTETLTDISDDPSHSVTKSKVSEGVLTDAAVEGVDEKRDGSDGLLVESCKTEEGESAKKVTFMLEPELINGSGLCQASTSEDPRAETSLSDVELSSHDETNTNEIIDQMFEEVLEYAGRMEDERQGGDEDAEDCDSGIGACMGDKDKMDTDFEKERSEEEGEAKEEGDESNGDELLTFPPTGILSPLSKSVEAVVTPLRLAASQESNPPSLLLTPEENPAPPVESAPLYSVDAYRTQRQCKIPTAQSVTPGVQRRAPEKSQPQRSVNTKERITALNEEAGKLQTVISQTLQALSCCTDEEHGRGSLEEAEAEKLLLVSCEKRSALLAEVSRLRQERNCESGEAAGNDEEQVPQQPCRGTVSITNIQLPLKVEFVCSSHSRAGRPSHYFFILIRYGPCNIIATPLATAADAQNGDTISFPTSVTLKDIRSSFEIDVEVYSVSHTSGGNCSTDRGTTKSRVTPRKLLNTITRSSNTLTTAALPALNARRSSNFCLVGSHKLTLASLGHSKFPLDKMKLEGKIRRLLGDEFQEKVPFLSPLEGNIYLKLDSQGHSSVQHQGFLTMFELISGYGVWHRRYFVLEECSLYYWNHPNDKETKGAEGCISLSSSLRQCVRAVKRDSCARPFTFELVNNVPHQQQDESQEALAKCWFSADTKEEKWDWMEKLNQVLLDYQTWNRSSAAPTDSQQPNTSSGNLRESIL